MDRRQFLSLSGLALVAAGCARAGVTISSTSSASAGAATIGLTYIPNIQFSPFYVAKADGEFSSRGVGATLRHHGSNEGLFTAIAAGQEQFVVAGADEMLQACAQGMDLVAIAALYRRYPAVVIVRAASAITNLAGLKGKRVGVPGRFGESWFALLVALATAGLTQGDVTISEIGYTQQAAIATGKVDAIVGFANNDAVQFAAAGVAVRQLPLAPSVPLVSASLITTRALLSRSPALARGIADAMVAGVRSVVRDPAHAIQASIAEVPGLADAAAQRAARATLDATISIMTASDGSVSGRLDPTAWRSMVGFMTAKGLLSGTVDATSTMSTDYVGA